MTNTKGILWIFFALIAIQCIDIVIHVGTGQVEPIRILSNGVIGLWALTAIFGKTTAQAGLIAIVIYLGLNGWFLAMHGITNPDQDGALRLVLFALVGLSTGFALWLRTKVDRD